jgi:GST-like protein
MIDLYTASTPNGHKASCTLEALALDYTIHAIDLGSGDQKQPEFSPHQSQWANSCYH